MECRPDWVVVPGDVNSTLAAALVAVKLGIPVAHVEAGLRSGDPGMPEEINRVSVTDQIASLHFTTSADAGAQSDPRGHCPARIHFVGNVMIDSLTRILPETEACDTLRRLGLTPRTYVLAAFHRPMNVDGPRELTEIVQALGEIGKRLPVIFSVHPRTQKELGDSPPPGGVTMIPPVGYTEFISLLRSARIAITDSGGVQEENNIPECSLPYSSPEHGATGYINARH